MKEYSRWPPGWQAKKTNALFLCFFFSKILLLFRALFFNQPPFFPPSMKSWQEIHQPARKWDFERLLNDFREASNVSLKLLAKISRLHWIRPIFWDFVCGSIYLRHDRLDWNSKQGTNWSWRQFICNWLIKLDGGIIEPSWWCLGRHRSQ